MIVKRVWCYMHLCSTYSICLCVWQKLISIPHSCFPSLENSYSSFKVHLKCFFREAFYYTHRRRELPSPLNCFRTQLDDTVEQGLHLRKHWIPRSNTWPEILKSHNILYLMKEHLCWFWIPNNLNIWGSEKQCLICQYTKSNIH